MSFKYYYHSIDYFDLLHFLMCIMEFDDLSLLESSELISQQDLHMDLLRMVLGKDTFNRGMVGKTVHAEEGNLDRQSMDIDGKNLLKSYY